MCSILIFFATPYARPSASGTLSGEHYDDVRYDSSAVFARTRPVRSVYCSTAESDSTRTTHFRSIGIFESPSPRTVVTVCPRSTRIHFGAVNRRKGEKGAERTSRLFGRPTGTETKKQKTENCRLVCTRDSHQSHRRIINTRRHRENENCERTRHDCDAIALRRACVRQIKNRIRQLCNELLNNLRVIDCDDDGVKRIREPTYNVHAGKG